MNIHSIVTKLGEPKYIVTLGLGFLPQDVTVITNPIRLNFTLNGVAEVSQDVTIEATPIRLTFQLSGAAVGAEVFILDFDAQINLRPRLQAVINTKLTFLAPVELEEEVMRVRIT